MNIKPTKLTIKNIGTHAEAAETAEIEELKEMLKNAGGAI